MPDAAPVTTHRFPLRLTFGPSHWVPRRMDPQLPDPASPKYLNYNYNLKRAACSSGNRHAPTWRSDMGRDRVRPSTSEQGVGTQADRPDYDPVSISPLSF